MHVAVAATGVRGVRDWWLASSRDLKGCLTTKAMERKSLKKNLKRNQEKFVQNLHDLELAERFESRLQAIEVADDVAPALRQKKKKLVKKKHITCSDDERGRKSHPHMSCNRERAAMLEYSLYIDSGFRLMTA